MHTIINDNDIKTLPQIRAFPDGTRTVEFTLQTKSERYDFVRRTLIRLAKTWLKHGQLRPSTRASHRFTRSRHRR